MKSQSKISINTPCSEKWEEMIPMERGKLCLRCDRLITDFTNKTDQEILDHIKASNGNICGRFKDDQLNRNLIHQVNPKIIPLWQKVAASLLLFVGVENAQAGKYNPKIFNYDYTVSKTDTDKNISKERKGMIKSNTIEAGDTVKVRGRVVDEKTNEGMPFAMIMIDGYGILVQTDFDGLFTLVLPPNLDVSNLNLKVLLIGYEMSVHKVKVDTKTVDRANIYYTLKNIGIKENQRYLTGEVTISTYKKWWQFWK